MKTCILIAAPLLCTTAFSNDWNHLPVPAPAGTNRVWELQPQSDNFNYVHPVKAGKSRLFDKWIDFYHHPWTGPGLTVWDRDHVVVTNGCLEIPASRIVHNGIKKVNTGCISSNTEVHYPLYIEACAKISNSVLASDVWMLSRDSTQEIDILEAYGADWSENADADQTWFSHRLHLSHHVFIRDPFQDYQPKDEGSWFVGEKPWREEFHRIGVHWKDPWNLDYYVNGKLVRSVSGEAIIDPNGFTEGTGLSKKMDIIINVEDQEWRSDQKITPSDAELENKEDHTYRVDWIRVYKPVTQEVGLDHRASLGSRR